MAKRNQTQDSSPVPSAKQINATMTFLEAIDAIIKGHKVTRLEWNNPDIYCFTKQYSDGTFFCIATEEFSVHIWKISDGDYLANDWVVIEEGNKTLQ